MSSQAKLSAYIFATVLGAVVVLFWIVPQWPVTTKHIVPLALFAAFIVAIELFEVKITTGAKQLPSASVDLAVWILFGPVVSILVQVVAVLLGDLLIKRGSPVRGLFNAAMLTISIGVGASIYHSLPWSADFSSPLVLIPASASLLICTWLNKLQMAAVISLSQAEKFGAVMRQHRGWHALSPLIDVPLAAFLIFSYQYAGIWALPLFAAPLLTAWQTSKMFEQMKESHKSTVAALTTALEADEPYTHGHSYRVAKYALQLGRRLGMSEKELETLEYGGLLHDIGKIAITNDIVCKPARLTKEEFDILASHPAIGSEIVEQMRFLEDAGKLVRHHHERPDGLGYPDGLKGDEISLGSHILNLSDAIDAMTSNRPYRMALTLDQCMAEVRRFRGTQFDERVVDALEELVAEKEFELIDQADGSALRIQQILREAATMQRDADEPAYAA